MASLAGKKGTKAIAGSSKLVGINYNKVNGLKYQNYTAMDTINRYGELMNSGGWMSADDLAKYKSAIDTYTTTGNSLRKLGKYTAEEDQSWLDAITSLNSGYEGATKFYSQFENENIYDYFASPYKSDFAENSKYVTTKYGDPHLNIWSNMYDDTGFGDVEYDYINKNEDAASIKFVNSQVNGYNPNGASNSQRLEMTDEEIAVFNYLYKTKGKDAAYAYTDYLKSDLNARQRQTIQDQWSAYAEANPVESSIFSVLISPLKGTAYIAQAADYLKTGSIDQNAIYNKDLFISGAIRDTVSNQVKSKWGDVGSFAYQTGMSMGDFLFNTAITGGNQTLSLALMGTGAAADTVMAAKDRGLDDTQAFLEGTIAGAIEIVCEKIGMDALFDAALAGKDALTYVVKNALAEGGEELLSSVVNFVADLAIARDKSEFAQDVQANGWGNALLNQGLSFAADALGGAISGGVLGSFGAGVGAINTSSQGSQIKRDGYEYKNFAYVANADAKSNFTQRMVDNVAKGKDLTNYQVGKLYGNTLEGGRNAITNAFEKRLTELKSKDAKAVAEALTKESLGEELSKKERNLLDNSKEVIVVRAEGMVEKARGNVDLGVSSPKIMTSKDENEKAETVNAENSGKHVEAVETIAADKLAGNKINQEASEAMVKGYDGKVSVSEYSKLYQAAYDAGASGEAQSSLSKLINRGLSQRAAFTAYDIGKNSVLKSDAEGGIINTESAEAKNESGKGVHLRGSVQRNNGENTEGQLSRVEKDSGKTEGRRDSSRSRADEEAARLVHEGREVVVADLGIPGGSKSQKIYRLEGVEDTAKMKKARKAAEKRGLVVRFFAGDNLMIETKDGTIENVRGYIQGKYVYIRADHPYYTADQIMRHELGHDMVAKGEVSIKKVIKRLTELVGEENVEAVLEHYAAAYAGTGLTVDEVWEEVICDSLGDMNIFAGDKVISEFMAPVLKDIKQAVSETKGEANKTRGAPTSNVLYNKRSGKNGWGKNYTAQEALNAAVEELNADQRGLTEGKASRELDSLGNELSNEQQNYFKDTKVRDGNGNLLVVYHGSPRGRTTVFDRNKTSKINDMGQGHYFSSNAEDASTYMGETKGRKLYEVYLNITKPFVVSDDVKISLEEAKSLLKLSEDKYAANDVYYYLAREAKDGYVTTSQLANTNISQEMTDILIKSGKYDGIIDETVADKWGLEKGTKHYVALEANQIKSTTNKNPSDNPDIRYSRELDLIDYINENGDGEITAKNKPLTNREILAGALESAVKSEKELEKLQEYKKNIKELNKKAYVLSKMKEDIKRLSFGKGNKDVAKIAELKEKAAKIERSINYYDRQLTNLEAMKPIQDLLQREKQKAYQRAAEKGREALKRNVEGRHKTAERNAIRKDAKDLEKLLNRGTKDRNIKEGEQDLVRRLLEITDLLFASDDELLLNGISTQYTAAEAVAMDAYMKLYEEYHSYDNAVTENKEKRANLRSQMNDLKKSFEGVLERERQRLNDVKAVTAFDALIKEYEGLKNSELNYIKDAYDSDIAEHLKALKESLGTTTIADMTLEQLETLHKAVTMVKTTIQNSNKLFKDNGKSVEDLGNEARIEIESKGRKDKITEAGKTVSKISWNNLKPVYLLERTGSKVLQKLGQAILDGESKWARIMSRARGFANEVKAKHGYKSWDLNKTHQFSNEFGQTFKVTTGQIMSIYAYSKRGEQALNHLRTDGFVMDKLKVKERNKIGIPIEYELNDKTAYKVSDVTLMEMLSKLTPEQKAYVDEMQKYLSEDMGNLGNEISMQLYGIKMFGEENYFPIHSSGSYLERVRQQQKGEAKIKNKGFTKPTQPNASNAIVLTPFNDVWSEHVSEMASYNAFTLPMEDFYKVYNYQTKSGAESVKRGVIPALENAYGEAAVNAIDQLLNDLNGGARTDAVEFEFKKLLTQFKRAKTLLSLSVVVQQPSAAIRAQAMIDPKFFVGKKIGEAKSKELWEEIKQYAPVAIIKEMGHFDVGMGRSSASWLMAEEYEGFAENVKGFVTDEDFRGDVLGYLPAKADEMAWATIWNAVKRETASNNPQLNTSSKEFLEIAGARFEDVIRHTQVYDSTLAKSANMRSKSTLMQMEMAFMAEPTTSMNMLEMALRSGKKSTILRVAGAVYASYLLNAILVALPYAMRDDDEDETFGEKYISALASSFLDNANPLASLPFLKDVWSLLQGYSIERTDMSLIEDALSTMRKIFKAAVNGEVDADAILNLAGSLSAFTGLPVANVIRDIKSIVNAGKTITREVEGMSTTWGSILDELQETAHSETPILSWMPKESKSDKLYDAIMRGDKAYIDRLRNSYSDFSAYKSAVRKALRDNDPRVKEAADAKNRGDMKTYEKILNEIAKENHFAADLIEGAIEAEANAIYNDFKESDERIVQAAMAMMLGDDKQRIAVEKEIVAEGQFTYDLVQKARKSETTNVTNLLKEAKEYVKAGRYEDAQVIYNELINRGYTQAFIDAYLKKIN